MDDIRGTDTLIQILHNAQKINEEDSWKEVSGKKKNRNSLEQ